MDIKILNEVYRLQSLMEVNKQIIVETSNPRTAIVTSVFNELIQKGETTAVKEILQKFGKNVSDELITSIQNRGIYEAISEAETDGMYNLIKQLTQSSPTYKSILSLEISKAISQHIDEIMGETFLHIDSHITKATPEQLDGYYGELMKGIEKEYPGTSENFAQIYYGKTGRMLGKSVGKSSEAALLPDWAQKFLMPSQTYKDAIISLNQKADKVKSLIFKPEDIKIINGPANLWGRETYEIKLPTGDNVILYKSTGTGAPDLKQQGDWQIIAGFTEKENGTIWFVKDEGTTQLSKGQNPYLTELDKYVKSNGIDSLGKQSMSSSTSKSITPFKNQSGQLVTSNSFSDDMIDWSKVTNAKNMEEYNKVIFNALKTGNYNTISRGGFEKYGIPNFREFLQTKIDLGSNVSLLDSNTWSFRIK